MKEIWKDIKGYEGCYQISNFGRVKSIPRIISTGCNSLKSWKGRIMKLTVDSLGYLAVHLSKGGKAKMYKVHRLVASSFLLNSDNKPQINHKNGIKTDNRIKNLEWCTPSENIKHAFDNGLKVITNLDKRYKAKGCYRQKKGKWIAKIKVNKNQIYLGTFDIEHEAKNAYKEAVKKYLNITV